MERKGICQNVGVCSKANKVQVITDDDADFKCMECGEDLQPYVEEKPKPASGGKKGKLYAVIAAAVLVLGGGAVALFSGGGDEPVKEPVPVADTVKVDSAQVAEPQPAAEPVAEPAKSEPAPAPKPEPKAPAGKNPSWGRYEGKRNASGLADGSGVLYITKSTTINGEQAQAGERIEGVFRNGYVNMGSWFKKDGNVVVVKDVKAY